MMISGWREKYSDILKEFKYSEKKDIESAALLDSILKKSNVNEKIINLVKGKTVFVIGSGPSLSTAIPKLKNFKKSIKIAADSSIKHLVENGIIPDIIITDLDGDENTLKKIAKTKSIFVVHAHGDNIRWAARVAVIRRELGTQPAQVENGVEPAHQVIGRNTVFQANLVKQTVLPYQPITHHRPDPSPTASGPENHVMNSGATGVLQHSQP